MGRHVKHPDEQVEHERDVQIRRERDARILREVSDKIQLDYPETYALSPREIVTYLRVCADCTIKGTLNLTAGPPAQSHHY